MGSTNFFIVEWQVRKANGVRGDRRVACLAAASQHPHDLIAVLANNFTLDAGASFDIQSVRNDVSGTEGQVILT